jgi:hypothetical protein
MPDEIRRNRAADWAFSAADVAAMRLPGTGNRGPWYTHEIHFVRFNNEDDFAKFSEDDERQQVLHLKDQSVRAVILVKGTAS